MLFMQPKTWEMTKRFYREFVRPYRWRGLLSVLLTIPVGSLEAAQVSILRPFCDEVMLKTMNDGQVVNVAYYPLLIILISVSQSLFKHFSNYLNTWVGSKISNGVKMALFEKLLHSDPVNFDKMSSGEMMLRYNNNADTVGNGLLGNMVFIVQRTATSLAMIAVMFYNSWMLSVVALAALSLGIVPMSRVRKIIKKLIAESMGVGTRVTTNYTDVYNGNRTVIAYNLYDQQKSRLQQTLNGIFRLSIKMQQRIGFMTVALHGAVAIGLASVLYIQGYLFVEGMLTPGNFVAFMVALILLYTPVKAFANNFSNLQMSFLAIGMIFKVLDSEPTITSPAEPKKLDGVHEGICWNNVDFEYDPGKPVLQNVNLRLGVGRTMAFVGNSGGGKTTLVNLLLRFYDVTNGSITIDGVDIRELDINNLRSLISIVFQDNFLFGGTLRDNIMLGREDAPEEDVRRAVKMACLEDFVNSLKEGLDTYIGERGTMLSGGQKQRVAIARAFLKDAPIVVLDEATSALDSKSEAEVQQAIDNLMVNKTVIIIAHRLSTVINADVISVVHDGRVMEQGRHEELMKLENGYYASLYTRQLK